MDNQPSDPRALLDDSEHPQSSFHEAELLLPAHTTPHRYKKRWTLLVLLIVALLLGGAYYWGHKNTPQSAVNEFTPYIGKKLCFVRYGYLVCEDTNGGNRVRYDLPTVGSGLTLTNVVPNVNNTEFVAYSDQDPSSTARMWLLDSKLRVIKQLTFPSGLSPLMPSFTRDGKALLLELDTNNFADGRQLYRYDLATGKATPLTTSGYNMQPYETKDGRIIYDHDDGSTDWRVYIMNSDGSNAQPLMGVSTDSSSNDMGFSYESATDMVYLFSSGSGTEGALSYGTVRDIMAGKSLETIHIPVVISGQTVVQVSPTILAVSDDSTTGTRYVLASGVNAGSLPNLGPLVGMLNPVNFPRSAQQGEQPHDAITNLKTAPVDFQAYIEGVYDKENAICADQAEGAGVYSLTVRQVVRDSFASTGQGCGDGAAVFYSKVSGVWQKDFETQAEVDCATINRYAFTKEIIPQCLDQNGNELDNTNP